MREDDRERLQAFARGEATWAEVEGITAADAARLARTGVELAQAGRFREAALVFESMVELEEAPITVRVFFERDKLWAWLRPGQPAPE